jgi:hypothetical protein
MICKWAVGCKIRFGKIKSLRNKNMKTMKNMKTKKSRRDNTLLTVGFSLRILIVVCLLSLASCNYEEYASADYPAQKVYIPAADGETYLIDNVPVLNLTDPTPGQPYRFVADVAANTFTVPLAVYRSGVDNKGTVNIAVSADNTAVEALIADGELPDTQLLPGSNYTLSSSATIADGKSVASFELVIDLQFLKANAPKTADENKKFAVAVKIASNDREVTPELSTVIVLIDTKMMNPVADFYFQTETDWNRILFNNTSKYAVDFSWSFGDEASSTDYTPRHFYGKQGVYPVSLTVTGVAGDKVTKTLDMPVLNILPLDKSKWSVAGFSSEEPGEATAANPKLGYVAAVFDDNPATYWSTAYRTGLVPYPHWFVLDLGATYTIKTVETVKRQNNRNGQTAYRLFTSLNGTDWEDWGEHEINQNSNDALSLELDYPKVRYVKYEAIKGKATRDIAYLAEISLYGSMDE